MIKKATLLTIIFFEMTVATNITAMLTKKIATFPKLKNYQLIQQRDSSTKNRSVIKNKELLFDAIVYKDKDLEHVLQQRGVGLSGSDINLIIAAKSPDDFYDKECSLTLQALHKYIEIKRETLPPHLKLLEAYSHENWHTGVLFDAVRDNDIEIATLALKKGVDPNNKAILEVESVEMFQLLQKNGCNIHVERGRGWICPGGNLLHMIMQGHVKNDQLIEYIFTQGLDVKALNGDGGNLWASLTHGCEWYKNMNNDRLFMCTILLHVWNLDPYHKNYKGYNAFEIAEIEKKKGYFVDERYKKLVTIMKYRDFTQDKNKE
jgi:hypothetical protein